MLPPRRRIQGGLSGMMPAGNSISTMLAPHQRNAPRPSPFSTMGMDDGPMPGTSTMGVDDGPPMPFREGPRPPPEPEMSAKVERGIREILAAIQRDPENAPMYIDLAQQRFGVDLRQIMQGM